MTSKNWGLFFALASALVLISVFVSQFIFHMHPCKLCIWQRWPFAVTFVLGFALVFLADKRKTALMILALLSVTFLISSGLGLFHWGVENKWWEFHSDCTGGAFKPGASAEEVLAALKAAPSVRCDQVVPFLFGLTMAFYNTMTSCVLAVIAAVALYRQRSNSLSQYK